MAYTIPIVLACCLLPVFGYSGTDLPAGPYCGINRECCTSRQDSCSHRILGTLCYCDEFCNRTRSHDDCCPDYHTVCLGLTDPLELKQPCRHQGKEYYPGETRADTCNTCECLVKPNQKEAYWNCTVDVCMMSNDVVSQVNHPAASWRAQVYPQFMQKKLREGLVYKLGTLPLSRETRRMGAIRYDKDIDYPPHFDSRERWPSYISPVVDQGWCGSDWAVSIAGVASDRFAIMSNGAENKVLSPQSLLSCNRRQQKGCDGGHIDVAWNYARSQGLVDEDCFPYEARMARCPLKPKGNLRDDGCVVPIKQRTERYKVGPPYRLKGEQDIMYDILESGPVQAVMKVYQDFFHYRDGVYRHSPYGNNELSGLHSVRIVGWGENRNDKYWIVANSWGERWGENGYFLIARNDSGTDIESFVVSVWSEVTESYKKK